MRWIAQSGGMVAAIDAADAMLKAANAPAQS